MILAPLIAIAECVGITARQLPSFQEEFTGIFLVQFLKLADGTTFCRAVSLCRAHHVCIGTEQAIFTKNGYEDTGDTVWSLLFDAGKIALVGVAILLQAGSPHQSQVILARGAIVVIAPDTDERGGAQPAE